MIFYIKTIIKNFLSALHIAGKYNMEQNVIQELNDLKKKYNQIQKDFVDLYYQIHTVEAKKFSDELDFLKKHSTAMVFPYERTKQETASPCGYDSQEKLPFVLHKEKKLYFPNNISPQEAFHAYDNYINNEHILEKNYIGKAPHQYQTLDFQINQGDILLDIGCAEALLTLDNIEKIKKAYLFESDESWIKPLKATFRNYQDKVVIINKLVSNKNNKKETLLSNIIKERNDSFFVKMDIEGAEEDVLLANLDFFNSVNEIKAAICTYHKHQHEHSIKKILEENGFKTFFSEGFMLPYEFPNFIPPFFRKGLIRATKKKQTT